MRVFVCGCVSSKLTCLPRACTHSLYVRKVLIADEFEDLMPRYLNFIKGVVDSDDLPLNVSRETLQQHKVLKVMAKKLVRKALEMLRKLAQDGKNKNKDEDAEKASDDGEDKASDALADAKDSKYIEFWKVFGKNIKLGVIEDSSNRSKLAKVRACVCRVCAVLAVGVPNARLVLLFFALQLLRFQSSKTDADSYTSLDQYVANMKEWQKNIFYIAGENIEAVKSSAFLERFKEKDVEVLFLTDPIDEYAIQNLSQFDGKTLQSITKENVKFGDEVKTDKKRDEVYTENFKPLVTFLTETYGSKVEKVAVSNRLSSSPCILSTSQYGYSANMERIMRAQAFADPSKAQHMVSKKTMEINPRHPIIVELLQRVGDEKDVRARRRRCCRVAVN